MPEAAEILCSRCGTPFPKDKGKTAVTCVVCGQLRPDLDLTLDDDDDDMTSALSAGAGGGATAAGGGSTGGGGGSGGGGEGSVVSGGSTSAAAAMDPDTHVLRVAAGAGTGGGIDSPQPARSSRNFRLDHTPQAESRMPMFGSGDLAQARTTTDDRLADRIGPVLLVVCPLMAGMAGGLNMLSLTDDFSAGTWYAVGVVFAAMLVASLVAGLAATGLLFMARVRWTVLLRAVFIAAAVAVGFYGMQQVPSHIQVRQNGLPGLVLRR